MKNVIPFLYQDQVFRFNVDGWINATDIAKHFGKRLEHWLENIGMQLYMDSLARFLNTLDSGYLIRSQRGRYGVTWLHPRMGVAFARWVEELAVHRWQKPIFEARAEYWRDQLQMSLPIRDRQA
ncbi:KilA-N domain-containing protein [Halomonas sp. PAMB 3232]|uniref:KilA-N domain-containing protein n=1 Tax=Halomonas sp. PAMB 3232 TaxID=3075221 RepID=UPI00289ABE16|nr:KilA-N domain-containing protein [Halomonas sp. PAMB 3232]WNL40467.1 KilA-N domain-containing protein [Halomonas sp. PAMB 3232]